MPYLGNSLMKTRAQSGNLSVLADRGLRDNCFYSHTLGALTYISHILFFLACPLPQDGPYHFASISLTLHPSSSTRDSWQRWSHLNQLTQRWFCLAKTLPKTSPHVPDREARMAKQPVIPRFVSFLKAIRTPKAPARGLKATCSLQVWN